jgi:hypothetical protein
MHGLTIYKALGTVEVIHGGTVEMIHGRRVEVIKESDPGE